MSESRVVVGQIWRRPNGNTYVISDERTDADGQRYVLLKPMSTSAGRSSWKWDAHVVFDMKQIGGAE